MAKNTMTVAELRRDSGLDESTITRACQRMEIKADKGPGGRWILEAKSAKRWAMAKLKKMGKR